MGRRARWSRTAARATTCPTFGGLGTTLLYATSPLETRARLASRQRRAYAPKPATRRDRTARATSSNALDSAAVSRHAVVNARRAAASSLLTCSPRDAMSHAMTATSSKRFLRSQCAITQRTCARAVLATAATTSLGTGTWSAWRDCQRHACRAHAAAISPAPPSPHARRATPAIARSTLAPNQARTACLCVRTAHSARTASSHARLAAWAPTSRTQDPHGATSAHMAQTRRRRARSPRKAAVALASAWTLVYLPQQGLSGGACCPLCL